MIKKHDLLNLARMKGMRPHQQEKHYIQSLVLRSIYSRFDPVFKGGTSLMFFFGLNRFSEDLDFTAEKHVNLTSLLKGVKEDMEYMGIPANYITIADNEISFSFRIGAEGPLFEREIERCFVRVEMSKREDLCLLPEVKFFEYDYLDILPFSVTIMELEEIAAEKIRAIMTRERARDLYDLQFLIKRGVNPTTEIINKKLSYYELNFEHDRFVRSVESKKDMWFSELKPIVFGAVPEFSVVRKMMKKFVPKT
jgi:hypothetical protein